MTVLMERIKAVKAHTETEDHLPDEQTGCSKARSAAQQTFALRLVVGKVKQRSIDL